RFEQRRDIEQHGPRSPDVGGPAAIRQRQPRQGLRRPAGMPGGQPGIAGPSPPVAKRRPEQAARPGVPRHPPPSLAQAQQLPAEMDTGQGIGNGPVHRVKPRPEQRAELRRAMSSPPLPRTRVGAAALQQGQRVVANGQAQARHVA
ncbi:hypothetical protein OY671_010945, partial [Metschnikowia pulcherrima]